MPKGFIFIALAAQLAAQVGQIRTAPDLRYPSPVVDGNSPGLWVDGRLKVYTSTGELLKMSGHDLASLSMDVPPVIDSAADKPMWIESIWRDPEGGAVYGWYHNEPGGYCPGKGLTVPRIGAVVSHDGGDSFQDLGIVLSSGDAPDCNAQNGFFAGGHGDFSVVLDPTGEYFYFVFDNYGGAAATQGVAIARLAFADRAQPVGNLHKYFQGQWGQPGIGGGVTPILPVRVGWEHSNTDAYWGPAVSWNAHIQKYIIFLNHACCKPEWPQEGIYLSYSQNLSDPGSWTPPTRILTPRDIGFAPGYYPQLVGTAPGETDSLTGQVNRIFVKGISRWELVFPSAGLPEEPEPQEIPTALPVIEPPSHSPAHQPNNL